MGQKVKCPIFLAVTLLLKCPPPPHPPLPSSPLPFPPLWWPWLCPVLFYPVELSTVKEFFKRLSQNLENLNSLIIRSTTSSVKEIIFSVTAKSGLESSNEKHEDTSWSQSEQAGQSNQTALSGQTGQSERAGQSRQAEENGLTGQSDETVSSIWPNRRKLSK